MRLILLGSRDTIIEKNNGRRDLEEIWKDEEMEYRMNEIINKYICSYVMRNNEKKY